jgi:hypothetical protein
VARLLAFTLSEGGGCIAWLGLRRNVHRALDRTRVACDLERVEVLLEVNGPVVADRPDVGDLCFAVPQLAREI